MWFFSRIAPPGRRAFAAERLSRNYDADMGAGDTTSFATLGAVARMARGPLPEEEPLGGSALRPTTQAVGRAIAYEIRSTGAL